MANAGKVANGECGEGGGGEFAKSRELVDVATVANVGYSLWIINICLNFEFSSAIKSKLQGFSKKSELPPSHESMALFTMVFHSRILN